MKQKTKANLLLSFGSICVILGIILAAIIRPVFNNLIENVLVIEEGSDTYESWANPPVYPSLKIYLFNVTNPDEIRFYGAKPIVQEVGPYIYIETWSKEEIEFNSGDGTVTYKEKILYQYDDKNSVGPDTDRFTLLNPLMAILGPVMYDNRLMRELVWPEIEEQCDLFEEYSVAEMFFEGFDLPVFDYNVSSVIGWTNGLEGSLDDILTYYNIPHPGILEYNKFAIFYTSNNTAGSEYTVYTGEDGLDNYLFIKKFGEMTELNYWDDPFCNMINGSDGTQYPPFLEQDDVPRLFMSDLCRSLYFEFEMDTQVHELVDTYRFLAPEEMLADPNTYAPNSCFCIKVYEKDEKCPGASMLNLAPCAGGLPIVMSTPHFYMGNDEDIASIEGFNPNKAQHETFLDIDPISGVVLNAEKRIQFNLPLRKWPGLPTFQSVPEVIFPLFWFSEGAMLSKEDAETMHKLYTLTFIVVYTLAGLLIVLGIILIILGTRKMRKIKQIKKSQK